MIPFYSDVALTNSNQNCHLEPKSFCFENPKNVTVGQLNINSLRSKFELLKLFYYNAFDIFFVSETKIDRSFPNN